jgi:hypothetical protein
LDLIMQRLFGLALGYEDLNDHDELRGAPMLAIALGKDDVKGEQRRRTQDRGKPLAGKSTLNRLELMAPDYDGSPRQKAPTSLRRRRLWWTRRASTPYWWICSWTHKQIPERIVLDLDTTDAVCVAIRKGAFTSRLMHRN